MSGENDRRPERIPVEKSGGEESPVRMTVDTMLKEYCGEFGKWQLFNFCLCNLSYTLEAFHTMVVIFADREPEWRCLGEPGCDPTKTDLCGLKPGSWEWVGGRRTSTVAEWDLICGDKYKVGLAQAMFFLGCTIGSGIVGHVTESSLGRKRCLMVVCMFNAIFGCLTALSPSYWIYILLRFLTGVSSSGNTLCSFLLSIEPIGPSKRGLAGMSMFYFYSAGIALISGIAFLFNSWRHLYIISSLPSLLYLFTILPFLSESPRWLLLRNKPDSAMNLMNSIALFNTSKPIPQGIILSLDNHEQQTNHLNSNQSVSVVDILNSPIARSRLLLGLGVNFLNSVVYYGLSLNVGNLKTDLYVNVLLNAVVEVAAFVVTTGLMMGLSGRRGIGIGTMWFSGVFCLVGSLMTSYGKWKVVKMMCGLLGIGAMAANYNLSSLYIAEMFPTEVRNVALGSASQATNIGAIVAPFVVVSGGKMALVVFGVCGVVGGILVFFLPETLNKPLYDTLAGLEKGENAALVNASKV